MSTTRSRGRGRGSNKPDAPLRKPGQLATENNVSQNDEKPPAIFVQKTETTANIASKSGPEQLAQGLLTTWKFAYTVKCHLKNYNQGCQIFNISSL